ncbi:MAG: hypothetical protein AB4352_20600 [Hormoscilla sp.]
MALKIGARNRVSLLNIGIDAKIVPETRFLLREYGPIAHLVPGRDRGADGWGRGTAI